MRRELLDSLYPQSWSSLTRFEDWLADRYQTNWRVQTWKKLLRCYSSRSRRFYRNVCRCRLMPGETSGRTITGFPHCEPCK